MSQSSPGIDPGPSSTTPPSTSGYTLEQVRTTCLLVMTILASAVALSWLRPVVVPFLVALALYYLLTPVRSWLVNHWGFSEKFALAGAAAIGFFVAAITVGFAWACVAEVTRDADVYAGRLAEMSSDPTVVNVIQNAGFKRDPESGHLVLLTPEQTRNLVLLAVGWMQLLLSDTFLVLAFLLFMLLGNTTGRDAKGLPHEVAIRVRRYLVEMFVFSVITGFLVGGILGILGVKFWLSFGFLAFILNFIPTIGPILATVLPMPVVLLDPNLSHVSKGLALAMPALVQIVIGNIIQPRFQSRTQGVHPVAAMMALIVFGMLWGAVGAVLAVPLAAVLKIAFEKIPGGRPFSELLAGRLEDGKDS